MKKCRQGRLWNFQIFSKFTKFHQTDRIYWNMHVKIPVPYLFNFTKFHQTYRIHWNHHLKNVKFESITRSLNFSWKKLTELLWNLFKVHQISSNWQNLLKSSSETCMWNLSPFREVKNFHEKMPTGPAIEILWKFHTFSKFTKFHQTYRIYWNHHLKHACEIWVHSEKLKFFMKKCRQCRL